MPTFDINGLQYFGVISLYNNGSALQCSMFEIYNNTGSVFSGGYIASSQNAFPIQSSVINFDEYNYSITFTPINLIQSLNPLGTIPYYLIQTLASPQLIQVAMADYQGNDFVPDGDSDSIVYYINIRLT
jgi:hypothetical protein